MKKSLLLAASFLAVAALAGCTEDTTDDTSSSTNDIVTGDQRNDTGADYGTQKPKEDPLPALDGNGADGTVAAKKLIRLPASIFKPDMDIPKPPVEGPTGETLSAK